MSRITSPEEFFGFIPGSDKKLIKWEQIVSYYKQISNQTGKIKIIDMGSTTEGRPFIEIIISCEDNIKNLDKYQNISLKLADPRGCNGTEISDFVNEGKTVCVQSMSLHASEIGGSQMAPMLVYDLITGKAEDATEILENTIFILIPCSNPDGLDNISEWYDKYKDTENDGCQYPDLFHKFAGHENNRDAVGQKLIESYYIGKIIFNDWMPQL